MKRIVPPNIARWMSPEERKKHGIETPEESLAKAIAKSEKEEHQTYLDWCALHNFLCRHDRTDKATTGNVGWPDFLFIHAGRVLPIEMKLHGNKLSDAQKMVHRDFARDGTDVLVVYSADEAIRRTKGWLWEHFRLEFN